MLRLPQGKAILAGINLQLLTNSQNQEINYHIEEEWYDQIRWIMKMSLLTVIEENHYPFFWETTSFVRSANLDKQLLKWLLPK